MPLFITYASYSNTGIKGIIEKPIDRTEPIRTLVEKAGGKLIAAYMTTGSYDVVIVTEQADGSMRSRLEWPQPQAAPWLKSKRYVLGRLASSRALPKRPPGLQKGTFRLGGDCGLQGSQTRSAPALRVPCQSLKVQHQRQTAMQRVGDHQSCSTSMKPLMLARTTSPLKFAVRHDG